MQRARENENGVKSLRCARDHDGHARTSRARMNARGVLEHEGNKRTQRAWEGKGKDPFLFPFKRRPGLD